MEDPIDYPDAVLHKKISFIKSGLRLVGYVLLLWVVPSIIMATAVGVLVASEAVGIIEELV